MTKTMQYYSQNAKSFIAGTQGVDMSGIQNEFSRLIKPYGRILDLGCGSGRDTLHFLKQGFLVDAVDGCCEFCDETKRLAADYLAQGCLTVCHTYFSDLKENKKSQEYDGIWACASLLHVPKAELPHIMEGIESMLKEGAIFYCSFKQGSFEGIRNGRYFSDFDEDELRDLVKMATKLSIKKLWHTKDVRPGRSEDWLNSLWIRNLGLDF